MIVPKHSFSRDRRSRDGQRGGRGFFTMGCETICMVDVLDDKRTATRFRILVEIAERQPAVSQTEIADVVGVTNQAVSEYIRDLIENDLVEKLGRSRYQVTNEGVDWLFQTASDVRRFVDHVTEDVLESVNEEAAIATDDIEEGDVVSLSIADGLLHATPGDVGPATGIATTDASAGVDVGVSGFEGVIDLEAGEVTIIQVPSVGNGGSGSLDADVLHDQAIDADLVLASGIEAIVSLRRADIEPATTFSVGTVTAEAAERGLDVLVVTTGDVVNRVTDELHDIEIQYYVREPR